MQVSLLNAEKPTAFWGLIIAFDKLKKVFLVYFQNISKCSQQTNQNQVLSGETHLKFACYKQEIACKGKWIWNLHFMKGSGFPLQLKKWKRKKEKKKSKHTDFRFKYILLWHKVKPENHQVKTKAYTTASLLLSRAMPLQQIFKICNIHSQQEGQ